MAVAAKNTVGGAVGFESGSVGSFLLAASSSASLVS